jgi:quercetin dioxygenase-like cupin family protein
MAWLVISCARTRQPHFIAEDGVVSGIEWSAEELASPRAVVLRTLRSTQEASHHAILLRGSEQPHVHDRHDLTVFVLKGSVELHIAEQSHRIGAGDVIYIPRGTIHWAKNLDCCEAAEAYVIFSPAFDGKDERAASIA